MNTWSQLEKDLTAWLKSEAEGRNLIFRGANNAIVGFPYDGFRSDGMVTDGDRSTLLALEIEASQTHPDTNVGKYWLLTSEYPSYKRIVLFHVYTPAFNSYPWRKKLAEFYAERLTREFQFEYVVIDHRQTTDYQVVLEDVKTQVSARIEQEFRQTV